MARAGAAGLYAGGFLEVPADRGGLDGELKGVVLEGRDGDGHRCVGLVLLGASVEVFAEGHQVQSILPQRWAHRWCRPGSSCRHCQPDRRSYRPSS